MARQVEARLLDGRVAYETLTDHRSQQPACVVMSMRNNKRDVETSCQCITSEVFNVCFCVQVPAVFRCRLSVSEEETDQTTDHVRHRELLSCCHWHVELLVLFLKTELQVSAMCL